MSASEAQHPTKRRIIDAHHHFWDPTRNYHPWLCDPEPIPFRYGDYSALRKPYLIHDYLRDTRHYQVEGSVLTQRISAQVL